jgi:hypothetical protein
MSDLLDNILNENYVEANEIFESRMSEIAEKKLYEVKRSMDITEVVKPVKGKPGEFAGVNTKKDWTKYRKQHPSLGMHDTPSGKSQAPEHEKTASGGLTRHGIKKREERGYLKAHPALKSLEFIKAVTRYHKTGKIDETTIIQQKIEKETKKAVQAGKEAAERRKEAGQSGKTYTHAEKEPAAKKTSKTPSVELPPEDVRRKAKVARERSRVFSSGEIDRSKKAPPDRETAYQHDKDVAHALHRDNHPDAMSRFKKEYSGYETGKKIKSFAKGVWNALGEDTE